MKVLLLGFLLWSATGSAAGPAVQAPPTEIKGPLGDPRIVVHKSSRELWLYEGEIVVRRFPVGLGFAPEGHKAREGDGATPEGRYTVCVKNPQSRYHLSLGLDYPGRSDAERGLGAGRITADQHARIVDALERGVCPPWDTPLGGEIYIHGRGSAADWTLGCVALDDPDIETLFRAVGVGTSVEIRP
ncbi:MAG: L,D-transpeptidase [Acidobacteriota bacterium]